MKTQLRITKKHVGRPVNFFGWNRHANVVCQGRVVEVKNRMARLAECNFPGDFGSYDMVIEVNSKHLVEIL